jgi:hypothetical protein
MYIKQDVKIKNMWNKKLFKNKDNELGKILDGLFTKNIAKW